MRFAARRFLATNLWVALLMVMGTVPSGAQTIVQGTVTDLATGQPLGGATVAISGGNSTLTDGNGQYTIAAQQGIPISGGLDVRQPGYFYSNPTYDLTAGTPVTVDVALVYGGTILQGTVTDANTENPVANASISFGSGGFATADSNGFYTVDASRFSETNAGGFTLSSTFASAPGYFNLNDHADLQVNPPFPVTRDITLVPSTGTIVQGTVTDQATGQPLAGATVAISGGNSTLTDGNGQYTIAAQQGIPISGGLDVRQPGYFYSNPTYDLTAGTPVTVDVALVYGGTILQGTVTDANTEDPVANASISFGSGGFATADSNGFYTVDASRFSETNAGGFTLSSTFASAPGYFNLNDHIDLQVNPPFPVTRDITLVPSTGTIVQGTVTDQATGQPLAGATVAISGGNSTLTDGNGQYTIAAQQGIPISGGLDVRQPGYFYSNPTYDLTAGTPVTVDVALVYGGTILQGTITDANTEEAVANASVSFGGVGATTTDLNGFYTVDASRVSETKAGGFTIFSTSASAAGYFNFSDGAQHVSPPFPATRNLQLIANGISRTVDIVTDPPGLQIVVDGSIYIAPRTFTWRPSNPHTIATTSPQTLPAVTNTQYAFEHWSDSGALSHTIVAPADDSTFTATFTTQYLLTTTVDPQGAGSITAGGWIDAGSNVNVTASAAPSHLFDHFSGDVNSTSNPISFTMNAPTSVTAHLVPIAFATTTSLASSLNPAPFGSNVTFTATVTSAGGTPQGTVTFTDGVTALGSTTLDGSGVAALAISTLAAGNHTITAAYGGTATFNSSIGTLDVTITPPPERELSISDATVTEGNAGTRNITFTVVLSAAAPQVVTVNYALVAGTAAPGSDFVAEPGTVTFNPGVVSRPLIVRVVGDQLDEDTETFTVDLSGPTNAGLADPQGLGTITDNDTSRVSIGDASANEGDGGPVEMVFTVSLSVPNSRTVTVNYSTLTNTATSDSDFLPASGVVTFAPGDVSQTLSITVVGDLLNEADERFFVALATPTNATVQDGAGLGSIADNDPLPGVSIGDVVITEGNSGFLNATFTLTLSAPSGHAVRVGYATANGSALAGADYTAKSGNATFVAGTTFTTVFVRIRGDRVDESNEAFFVNLNNPRFATILDGQAIATIVDNDP